MGSQLYENLPESQLLPQLNGGDSPPAGGLPWDWIQCVHDTRPEGVEITQGTGQGALQREGASLQAVPHQCGPGALGWRAPSLAARRALGGERAPWEERGEPWHLGGWRLGGPGPPWSRGGGEETCTLVLPILRCPQAWGGPGTESRLAPTGPSDLPSSVQLPSAQHFACRGTCCWARRSFLNSGKVRKKAWSLMDVPHTQVLTNWIPL